MRRYIERLEDKNLLAGDVQLVYGVASEPDEQGVVTRQIRVYADAEGDVLVESSLTDEFEEPNWELSREFSNTTMDLKFLPDSPDFRIEGARLLQNVGDLNGDDRDDFLYDESSRATVIYGGFSDDITVAEEPPSSTDNHGFVIDKNLAAAAPYQPTRYSNLGDINGDGFNDLAIEHRKAGGDRSVVTRIIWGSDSIPKSNLLTQLPSFPAAHAVGDVNADGFDDLFIPEPPPTRFATEGVVGHLVYGATEFNEDFSPQQMVADGRGVTISKSNVGSFLFIESTEPIGDLNADGFDDFMLGRANPHIIYGGPVLNAQTSINLDMRAPDPNIGFLVGGGGITHPTNSDAEIGGVGDVNGDGLDDVLISYDGGDCEFCTATDRDNYDRTGGGLILYGGTEVGVSGTFDPSSDPHSALLISTVISSGRPKAELHDVNGDGLMDVHLSAELRTLGREHIVIAGRPGMIPHMDFGHTFDCCDELVDGVTTFAFQVPPRESFRDEDHNFQYLDINADGFADALSSAASSSPQVYLGRPQSPPVQGQGDIQEVVRLDPHSSAVFTVRGVPQKDAQSATTLALPTDGTDLDITNNVASPLSAVSLSLELDLAGTISVGDPIDAILTITNSGPSDAISAQLVDSLFEGADLTWTQMENPFPRELDLRQTDGIFAASIPAPERTRFHEVASSSYLNEDNLFSDLGGSLGTDDFNADGFDDVIVHFESMQNPGPQCFTCLRDGTLVFEGGPTFGSGGQFPTPSDQPSPTASDHETVSDFNGDGLPDSIVRTNPHTVEVRYGIDSSEAMSVELDGDNGFSVATQATDISSFALGDLNGDGFDDLIIGDASRSELDDTVFGWFAPWDPPESRQAALFDSDRTVHVVYGTDHRMGEGSFELDSIDGRNGFRMVLQGSARGSRTEVLSNFDVNGDGVDDLLIGDPNAGAILLGPQNPGAVYAVFGRAAVNATGEGSLGQTIDVKAGTTIELQVRGNMNAPLSGSIQIEPATDHFELYPETNSVVVEAQDVVSALTSDLTGDGIVNFDDFLILSANFGTEVSSREEGDVNEDGIVDFDDFLILSSEYGL